MLHEKRMIRLWRRGKCNLICRFPARQVIFFILFFIFAVSHVEAQLRYGNEWIDFQQKYYKIRLCADGIYKISYLDLKNAGIPVESLHPGRYQLFFRGSEQYLFIEGAADGKFDVHDRILFYGQKNDGKLDEPLYAKPSDQHHQLYSLYTDSSFYFLTWTKSAGDTNGLRMSYFSQINYNSFTAESYLLSEKFYTFNEQYFDGVPIVVKNDINRSVLTYGEGWLSKSILNSQTRLLIVDVPGITFTGNQPTAEILAFGKSETQNFTGNDHQLQVSAGTQILFDTLYKGFAFINKTFMLTKSQVDTTAGQVSFSFTSPQLAGVNASQTSISYIKLNYNMKPDLMNRSAFAFRFAPAASGIRYFRFFNYPFTKNFPVLFDLTHHRVVGCSLIQDTVHMLLPLSSDENFLFLADTADYLTAELNEVQFTQYNPASLNNDFLIITHPKLSESSKKYADYRNTKGYSTLVVQTQQLYDQFYYGYHHPLAIRHFIDYIWQSSAVKPQYLLLLGKGLENNLVRNPLRSYPDPADLVPAIGFPCSEGYFSSGIDQNQSHINEMQITPALATGRIAASTDSMVYVYLNKLKEYESSADAIWKKDILHIGGEQEGIQDSLAVAGSIATDLPFGGNVYEIYNHKNDPVVYEFKDQIQNRINNGLTLLTYFAHGSQNVLGIDMGRPSDLKNKGKYPLMFMNGCNVGNPNSDYSLGEDYIFAPEQGAIGWLAHNTSTFIPTLGTQINGFYNELFHDSYNQSVAAAMKNQIAMVDPSILPDREFYQQWIFQGDPALKIYQPAKADYYPDSSSVSFDPEMIFTTTDSFSIQFTVFNEGKSADSNYSIKIERSMPDKTIRNYLFNNVKAPLYSDTYNYKIETGGRKAQGINKFSITVNADTAISESDYSNNTVSNEYFFSGSGVYLLMPPEFGIAPTDSVILIVQNRNLLDNEFRTFTAQIDTTPGFNSPLFRQLPDLTSDESVISWNISVPQKDSTVYYWRAMIKDADSAKKEWENSSFVYIKNSPSGWSQSHFPQFKKDDYANMLADSASRQFVFSDFSRLLSVTASRWTHINRGIKLDYTLNLNPGVCSDHNIVIIRFDGKTLEPSEINPRCNGDIDVNYRSFNMFLTKHQDSLADYINSIPDGDYAAVFTRYAVNFPNWKNNVYDAFDKIGATPLLRGINNDLSAYVLIGKKYSTGGFTIAEDTVYEPVSPAIPANSKTAEITEAISGSWYQGSIVSTTIGPSQGWGKLHFRISGAEPGGADSFHLSVIGIGKNGGDTILKSDISENDSDISFINDSIYPNIKLKLDLSDPSHRTALQLKRWQVTYDPVPEGCINKNADFSYHADSLNEGDTFSFSIPFKNISALKMENLLVKYSFVHQGQEVYTRSQRVGILNAGSSVVYSDQIPTLGLSGQNKVNIMFNPDNDQPELYLNNNSLSIPFIVSADDANPLLDVTFNGRHILNGDIVSAQPVITITSKDENNTLLQKDTGTFEISLKGPTDVSFHRIWFSQNKLTFYAATDTFNTAMAVFKPGMLADGTYTLKVQSYDKSGIAAGATPYQIDFNVFNQSKISDVMVFPNPFSDLTNFRFTITGYTLPSEMIINIYATDGRLVKEIRLTDESYFYIGRNTIPNAWDGTDQNGTLVQNGLYIYQMFVKQFAPGITPDRAQLYLLSEGKLILIR